MESVNERLRDVADCLVAIGEVADSGLIQIQGVQISFDTNALLQVQVGTRAQRDGLAAALGFVPRRWEPVFGSAARPLQARVATKDGMKVSIWSPCDGLVYSVNES